MELFRRRQDGKFPCYLPEVERGGYKSTERKENGKTVVDREAWVYDPVVDVTDMTIDFQKFVHGNYQAPRLVNGQWQAEREVLPRDVDSVNEEYWQDVRNERDAELARTDVLVLRALEETLVGHDDLKEHRRKLRNITNPQLNGGRSNPKEIKVKKF